MAEAPAVQVPIDWEPWPHQRQFWNARFRDGKSRFVEVWHRRAGKDITAINMLVTEMFERPGTYWHVFPTYAQAKKAIWNGKTNTGNKFMDFIPEGTVVRTRGDEMLVEVDVGNGKTSIYQLIGGDQPDRLVGTNVMGVIMSEYSLMNPICWQLVQPIVEMNDGWVAFLFTPRGYNHAHKLYENVRNDDEWHTSVLDITRTSKPDGEALMTPERVKRLIAQGTDESLARQEYYCDWSAPMTGAYYGKEMDAVDRDGRITEVKWQKDEQVVTWWDLGVRDTMVIWFAQIIGGWVHLIDYYAASGEGIEHYARVLDRKPYIYKAHYAPHDVKQREVGTGKSVLETAMALGLRFQVVPKLSVENGINAVRMALPKCKFDAERCDHGISALRQYRKEWDAKNQVWGAKPVHDWCSHPADAFRTGAVMLPAMTPTIKKAPIFGYEQSFNEMLADHDRSIAAAGSSMDIARL